MFVSDLAALTADPRAASAPRCRAVLKAAARVRTWIAEREVEWLAALAVAEGRTEPQGAFSRAVDTAWDAEEVSATAAVIEAA